MIKDFQLAFKFQYLLDLGSILSAQMILQHFYIFFIYAEIALQNLPRPTRRPGTGRVAYQTADAMEEQLGVAGAPASNHSLYSF